MCVPATYNFPTRACINEILRAADNPKAKFEFQFVRALLIESARAVISWPESSAGIRRSAMLCVQRFDKVCGCGMSRVMS